MFENKELKLDEKAFDNTIANLRDYKSTLDGARESIILINDNMKKDWLGDGGTAFMLSANVVEARFLERINDLEQEAKDLQNAKDSLFGLDYYLAKAIGSSIEGAKTIVAEISSANNK